MIAYELNAHFKAGLLLVGQEEDGELQWMGSKHEFQLMRDLIANHEDEMCECGDPASNHIDHEDQCFIIGCGCKGFEPKYVSS